MSDYFESVDLEADIDCFDDQNVSIDKTYEDYLEYIGRPSQDIRTYQYFIDEIFTDFDSDDDSDDPYFDPEELREKFDQIVSPNIKNIYTAIDYPLRKPAQFKFTIKDNIDVTFGFLLYTYTVAYQMVYEIEDEEEGHPGYIKGMFNRQQSNGKFGIWGHDIGDLVYNGCSKIHVSGENVFCYFDCDS